ncbi:helix-turn-helix domain-containing protein [Desulfofundulus sp.]|uniref:helix-turn-helix domain-containing protein n=1 Tax=Desulfofundulus sp. TaxID=2282750 RepID=UPI003C71B1A5
MSRLRELRKRKKLSAEKMAEILGISVPYLYDLENGRRRLNQDLLVKLYEKFGVSADYILGNDKKTEPDLDAPLYENNLGDALLKVAEMVYEYNLPPEVRSVLFERVVQKFKPLERGDLAAHGPRQPGSGAFKAFKKEDENDREGEV